MPRDITEMPKPAPRGNRKYDWDSLIGDLSIGQKRAFDKGVDFTCKATSFAVQARGEAADRGLSLHIPAVSEDSTVVSVEARAPKADESDTDES